MSFNGDELEVLSEDLHNLLEECKRLVPVTFDSVRIGGSAVTSRSQAKDLLLLQLDGHIVALKRCAGNPLYVRREVVVHHLRLLCSMKDYAVRKLRGIRLRASGADVNCPPLQGWESSELVLIDFGKVGSRKNFYDLFPNEIGNLESFFDQYGRWCAFNYVIGAGDRHPRNFVYDIEAGVVYSVDNEESPVDAASGKFPPFDRHVHTFRQSAQKFIPAEDEPKRRITAAFERGFLECWNLIRQRVNTAEIALDVELASVDAKPDVLYCRAVLSQVDPFAVMARIIL